MVIGHTTAFAYPGIWVGLPVSLGINYPGRVRIGPCLYCRAVNIDGIVLHVGSARSAGVIYFVNGNPLMRNALYICRARTCNIRTVVVHIGIIDNGSVMYNIYHPIMRHVIIINPRTVYITIRGANPVIIGYIIAAANYYRD